jgi:DNA-binding CsgD family transcriptional regulator
MGGELSADQWSGAEELLRPLPIGKDLEARFGERVKQLPPGSQRFMLVAAAESSGDPLLVRRVATQLGTDERDEKLACESGLIRVNRRVEFRHPLIRSAVYAAAGGSERRAVHLELAATIDASIDPERRAQHLVAAAEGADDALANQLVGLAKRAGRKGSRSSEAGLLSQAARLCASPEQRSALFLAAADAAIAAGAPQRAQALLRRAEPHLETPVAIAEAHRLKGRLQTPLANPAKAPSLLLQAALEFRAFDKHRSRQTLVDALDEHQVSQYFTPDDVVKEIAELAVRPPENNESPTIEDLLLEGAARIVLGDRWGATSVLKHGAELLRRGALEAEEIMRLRVYGAHVLNELWDESGYLHWVEQVVAEFRRTGALMPLPTALCALAEAKLRSGLFTAAETHFGEMLEIVGAIGQGEATFRLMIVRLLCWRGQEQEARDAARALIHGSEAIGAGAGVFGAKTALAVLELGLGNYREALADVQFVMERTSFGWEPMTLPLVIEAGVKADERTVAEVALDRMRESALASGTSWAMGTLRVSEALLSDGADPEPLFIQGLTHLQDTTVHTEVARAHLLYGEWLRRVGRRVDARIELRRANDMFDSMGARAFADRARSELRATGERARRRVAETADDLTPQERHIADLAARGSTNQEIATELFISASTVDYHLRKVYRKLGVGSRRQLMKVLTPNYRRDS